jgi:hypothetical protein
LITGAKHGSPRWIDLEFAAELWRCHECRSGFVQNAISEADAKRLYATAVGAERGVEFRSRTPPEVVTALKSILRPGSRVLDVGATVLLRKGRLRL